MCISHRNHADAAQEADELERRVRVVEAQSARLQRSLREELDRSLDERRA